MNEAFLKQPIILGFLDVPFLFHFFIGRVSSLLKFVFRNHPLMSVNLDSTNMDDSDNNDADSEPSVRYAT